MELIGLGQKAGFSSVMDEWLVDWIATGEPELIREVKLRLKRDCDQVVERFVTRLSERRPGRVDQQNQDPAGQSERDQPPADHRTETPPERGQHERDEPQQEQ